ncbi:hypothetical protein JW926_19000 [Candidatus Sumerlaeota bacterium]|nr:hypothetical protein [Candidatus Sumerlaeota bacterium]
MSAQSFHIQIKAIETQLSVLKAQVNSDKKTGQEKTSFASLFGILSGKSETTEEDIQQSEFKFTWSDHSIK